MNKNKIISNTLKILTIIIICIGVYTFCEHRLWRETTTDFATYLKTFLPILVLGFSGTLIGISALIDKDIDEEF